MRNIASEQYAQQVILDNNQKAVRFLRGATHDQPPRPKSYAVPGGDLSSGTMLSRVDPTIKAEIIKRLIRMGVNLPADLGSVQGNVVVGQLITRYNTWRSRQGGADPNTLQNVTDVLGISAVDLAGFIAQYNPTSLTVGGAMRTRRVAGGAGARGPVQPATPPATRPNTTTLPPKTFPAARRPVSGSFTHKGADGSTFPAPTPRSLVMGKDPVPHRPPAQSQARLLAQNTVNDAISGAIQRQGSASNPPSASQLRQFNLLSSSQGFASASANVSEFPF